MFLAAVQSPYIIPGVEGFIVFLAFVVRGFSGFGAGLVMTPLLAVFLDLRQAVVISILLQLVGGGYLTLGALKESNRKLLIRVLPASCLTSLIGVYTLTAFNLNILLLALGIFTLIFSVRMFIIPFKLYKPRHKTWSYVLSTLVGLSSGLLHGLYGAGGPPIVLFLNNEIPTRKELRSTLLIYFFSLDILLVLFYFLLPSIAAGVTFVSPFVIRRVIFFLIPTFAGSSLGYLLQRRLSETSFRRGVAFILVLTTALLIQKGLGK